MSSQRRPPNASGRAADRAPPRAGDSGGRGPRAGDGRGQTTLDFAIGVSLFLAIMLFVFAFVPGILEPFDQTGDHETIQTERVASQLSNDLLGSPSTPKILDTYCTVKFFDSGSPGECNYTGSDIDAKLNVEPWRPINVSIVGDLDGDGTEILCWDPGTDTFVDCGSGTKLTAGDPIPSDSAATFTSRRTVFLNHKTVRVKVVLW